MLALDWTCARPFWPPAMPFWTAPVAIFAICWTFEIASGVVDLIAVAASRPFSWNAWPTFAPSDDTPQTTGAPSERTLPDVSPPTFEATFALPSAAASLTPPPPPDWLCALLAAESIEPRTFDVVAVAAARPWAANVEPVCVASPAASVAVLRTLPLAAPCHEVTEDFAVEPADVTLPFAEPTALVTFPRACPNEARIVPCAAVPAAATSCVCLATAVEIAAEVRWAAVFSRAVSVATTSCTACATSLRPSLMLRRRSRRALRSSARAARYSPRAVRSSARCARAPPAAAIPPVAAPAEALWRRRRLARPRGLRPPAKRPPRPP